MHLETLLQLHADLERVEAEARRLRKLHRLGMICGLVCIVLLGYLTATGWLQARFRESLKEGVDFVVSVGSILLFGVVATLHFAWMRRKVRRARQAVADLQGDGSIGPDDPER